MITNLTKFRHVLLAPTFAMLLSIVAGCSEDVRKSKRVSRQYFFDLNTGELFEDVSHPGPITTSSGPHNGMPAGVRAVVLACHDCSDDVDRYVGWLEVPVSALTEHALPVESGDVVDPERTRAFRRPGGGPWALIGTAEADAITAEGRSCDDRKIPLLCSPDQ